MRFFSWNVQNQCVKPVHLRGRMVDKNNIDSALDSRFWCSGLGPRRDVTCVEQTIDTPKQPTWTYSRRRGTWSREIPRLLVSICSMFLSSLLYIRLWIAFRSSTLGKRSDLSYESKNNRKQSDCGSGLQANHSTAFIHSFVFDFMHAFFVDPLTFSSGNFVESASCTLKPTGRPRWPTPETWRLSRLNVLGFCSIFCPLIIPRGLGSDEKIQEIMSVSNLVLENDCTVCTVLDFRGNSAVHGLLVPVHYDMYGVLFCYVSVCFFRMCTHGQYGAVRMRYLRGRIKYGETVEIWNGVLVAKNYG